MNPHRQMRDAVVDFVGSTTFALWWAVGGGGYHGAVSSLALDGNVLDMSRTCPRTRPMSPHFQGHRVVPVGARCQILYLALAPK
jgi:hypothetical protein